MANEPPATDKLRHYARVATIFTPGAPIDDFSLFAGRGSQLLDVVNAVGQRGQHVVLFGERGVGKTSLANSIADFFGELPGEQDQRLSAVKVNCNTTDSFRSIWANVFRELGRSADFQAEWSEQPPDPEDIRYLLQRGGEVGLIIIDELDRLEDGEALSLLADTIKTLSDNSVATTIVLVGVADSIDDLVGDHASVERALTQVALQRMSPDELVEIIEKGLARLELTIDPVAKQRVAALSEGLPHYTHLLCLHATQRAVMGDRARVELDDVEAVIGIAVEKAAHSIRSAYQKATRSPRRESQFEQVLLACALADKDELGFFTARAVRDPLSDIMGKRYEIPAFARHLNQFADDVRGRVLQKTGDPRRYFYRFANPLLQPFVILSGLAHALITEEQINRLEAGPAASE